MKAARILYIDDDEMILRLVAKTLEQEGFEVLTQQDAHEAVRTAIRFEPDLVISDIAMAGLDGYGVLKRIKDNPLTAHVPVVFLTAMREPAEKVSAFRSGVVEYITKPFTMASLVAKIRRLLVGLPLRGGTVTGTLDASQFEGVLDMLQEGLRTGVLTVQVGSETGMIILKTGEVIDARFGGRTGEDAIGLVLEQRSGGFSFREADGAHDVLYDGAASNVEAAERFGAGPAAAEAQRRMHDAAAAARNGQPAPDPADDDVLDDESRAKAEAERLETAGRRLLVVDDDDALSTLLARVFEKEGFEVATARNGVEGFERARATLPDCIVTDLMMPHLDGFRLCELVREDRTLRETPLLMLSVKDKAEEWRHAIESGADDYLEKNTSLGELVFRVRLLIKRRAQEQRRASSGDVAVIRGELRHVGLPEVMAILEVNRKSGVLVARRDGEMVSVELRDGVLARAGAIGTRRLGAPNPAARELEGREAVAYASAWDAGTYEFVPDVSLPAHALPPAQTRR